jgi:hypothetical protein
VNEIVKIPDTLLDTTLMSPRGSKQAIKKNGISYYFGNKTKMANLCPEVQMITRISTSELAEDTWTVHDYGTC